MDVTFEIWDRRPLGNVKDDPLPTYACINTKLYNFILESNGALGYRISIEEELLVGNSHHPTKQNTVDFSIPLNIKTPN